MNCAAPIASPRNIHPKNVAVTGRKFENIADMVGPRTFRLLTVIMNPIPALTNPRYIIPPTISGVNVSTGGIVCIAYGPSIRIVQMS